MCAGAAVVMRDQKSNAAGRCACRSIQVRPFPRPLGKDGRAPLLSSCADAFHAANAHRGTTVRDCLFMNSGQAPAPSMMPC